MNYKLKVFFEALFYLIILQYYTYTNYKSYKSLFFLSANIHLKCIKCGTLNSSHFELTSSVARHKITKCRNSIMYTVYNLLIKCL